MVIINNKANLYILNGRTKDDLTECPTSENVSTIDYFKSSTNMFHIVDRLQVLEFCPLLSHIHCPVSLCLNFNHQPSCTCKVPEIPEVKLWDSDLSNITQQETIQEDYINGIVITVGQMFITAAENSF